MIRRLIVFMSLLWLAAACTPADPTRPPTKTPTLTVARATSPLATTQTPETVGTAESSFRETPVAVVSTRITATESLPTIDPLACLPHDPGQTGLVSWVNDGATFVIDLGGRRDTVRLLGVDAPPLAEDTTRGLIDQRVVRLVPDGPDRDDQGRLLRYVLLLDGRFINDELLRSGTARLGPDVGGLSCMAQFDAAEEYAAKGLVYGRCRQ